MYRLSLSHQVKLQNVQQKYTSEISSSSAMRKILAPMLLLLTTQLASGNHFNCANVCAEKGKDVPDHPSGSKVSINSLLRMLLSHLIGFVLGHYRGQAWRDEVLWNFLRSSLP